MELPLNKRSFAFYNTETESWYAASGEYEILVGSSSRDIRLSQKRYFRLDDPQPVRDLRKECPVYYALDNAADIPDDDFKALYGAPIPPNLPSKRGEFDENTTIGEFGCCLIGKIILKLAPSIIKTQVPNADMTTMLILTQGMKSMPLRGLVGISSGIIDSRLVDGLLYWGNNRQRKEMKKRLKAEEKARASEEKAGRTDGR